MPIYEYECTQCGQIEEAIQKFSDKPLRKCRHCSGKVQKLVSHSTFHLKGTGWYVTDYAGKSGGGASRQEENKASSTDTSSTAAKAESSTDTKKGSDKAS